MIYMTIKKVRLPKLTDSKLSWFLGFLCGDGCVHRDCYTVNVSGTDTKLLKKFLKHTNELFGLQQKFNPYTFTNQIGTNYQKVVIYSKELYYYLIKNFGSFYSSDWNVPIYILNGKNSLKFAFLKGYFEADGSFNFYRKKYGKIRFVSINRRVLEGIQRLLEDIGIKVNLIKEKNKFTSSKTLFSLNIYKSSHIDFFNKNVDCVLGE